jgi:RNA polymerase sigma-70 factor, ECF subfamily
MKVFHQSHVELETASGGNLVACAQRGEEAAFAALFDAYKHRVYGFCLRMTGSPQIAEDLTEEAFLGVFRKISAFRGEPAFCARLQRLAVKVVLMHLREKHVQEVPLAQKGSYDLWPQR